MEISIFRQKQRFKIGMAGKFNAEKVVCFSFVPVGALVDMGYCRYFRVAAVHPGADYDPAEFSKMVEVIDYFQLLVINPVNTGNSFYKEILPVKDLGGGHNFFRWQINIKMIAFGPVIRFFRARWGSRFLRCFSRGLFCLLGPAFFSLCLFSRGCCFRFRSRLYSRRFRHFRSFLHIFV